MPRPMDGHGGPPYTNIIAIAFFKGLKSYEKPMDEKVKTLFEEAVALEKAYDFEAARDRYTEIARHFRASSLAEKARDRLQDMDDLILEKEIYSRIDENGKRVLTEIGMNIAESPVLMDILMAADAIDYENNRAVFIPLKTDYVERCLELIPRRMACDPGINAFGTGATPPFLKRSGDDGLRLANRKEFEEIVSVASEISDVLRIFSMPVATDKSISDYEAAQLMEKGFSGLKMTATKKMSDDEAVFLKGKDDWLDGTSLITAMAPMSTMVNSFIRSAEIGNNLLLLDLTIAGLKKTSQR